MNWLGKLMIAVVVLALFCLGIFCGIKFSRLSSSGPHSLSTPALLVQVQALSELVTIKYVIEKVEVLEVPSENMVGQMIGSQNRILLLAHGEVKAGIDLGRLKANDLQ